MSGYLPYIPNELIYQIYNYVNPMTIMHSVVITKRFNKLLSEEKNFYKQYAIIKFFSQNLDKIHWGELSENNVMSEDFFLYHFDKIWWIRLCSNNNISESFFEKYIYYVNHGNPYGNWINLSKNNNISELFFENHIDKVYWNSLCSNNNISESFFIEHIKNVQEVCLCSNNNISEKFFERYLIRNQFHFLGQNSNISEKFFIKHGIGWIYIFNNPNVSIECLKQKLSLEHEKIQAKYLVCNKNITEEYIESVLDKIYDDLESWIYIHKNKSVGVNFIIKHMDKLCYNKSILVTNTCLTETFFNEYKNIFPVKDVCKNNNVSIYYFKKNINDVDWHTISANNFESYLNR
jgi:hypothetical protein